MKKGTVILIGGVCAALAGVSAPASVSAAPASLCGAVGGVWLGQTCPCDGDLDGSGLVQVQDILIVIDCLNGVEPQPPLSCDVADVNCDGTVDACDTSRVYCQFIGITDCCTNTACGACCSAGGTYYDPCVEVSEAFCYSVFIEEGDYLGDGTVCDPWPCDAVECTTDADCDDENVCSEDTCVGGDCVHEDLPNWTPCPDELFCNGDETCQYGVCHEGWPRSCDDGLSCTTDSCNEVEDTCVHVPAECNNDGVCDGPCETAENCPADCGECPCETDQDGDDFINLVDFLNVIDCSYGFEPQPQMSCDTADINCDGVIDLCDASRVWCAFQGMTDCCANTVCGACCNIAGGIFEPCVVVSESLCLSVVLEEGDYVGNGTVCDPWPCDAFECTTNDDCDDQDPCTEDVCIESYCFHETLPNWTPCPDELFCNGDETCIQGVCLVVSPRTCDDAIACTVDSCDEAEDVCVHTASECNNDGVCDDPCETAGNCPADCGECLCVTDQNGDEFVNIVDVLNVVDCSYGFEPQPPMTCDTADVNCDGVIDLCDASRVYCSFLGMTECCANTACGACCNLAGGIFEPCVEVSEAFCNSVILDEGDYLGDGTTCDPWPCESTPCSTDADCYDGNACTTDICTTGGVCVFEAAPDGTPCPDDLFCNGDEVCQFGACHAGPPRSCDDLNPCTIDTCDESQDACVHTLIECNHDGVCDAPCENPDNCPEDCSTCTAIRDLGVGSMAYCPEVLKTVRIGLAVPVGALTSAVEDVPPTGWTQISNISDGGEYDAENHKVKWGPLFAPFPGELTYDVVPPAGAAGPACFTGSVAIDSSPAEPICGDECIVDSCCPVLPADEPQPVCAGCSDDCTAPHGDGRVELCEVIRYACAWKRGCNDDLAGVSGSAYLWLVGECYCWDQAVENWVPTPCGQSTSGCCEGRGRGEPAGSVEVTGAATVTMAPVQRAYRDGSLGIEVAKARGLEITISIDPPAGTSATALDLQVPNAWTVRAASDGGAWDRLHGKVKWGPFYGDSRRTVSLTVRRAQRLVHDDGFTGRVSFDGREYPIMVERTGDRE
jgi:hypothetical protein